MKYVVDKPEDVNQIAELSKAVADVAPPRWLFT